MGMLLPHRMLLTYNVDEAIETLPLSPNSCTRVERSLMTYAPTAYQSPGVSLESIWSQLPTDVQEALNTAAHEAYKE